MTKEEKKDEMKNKISMALKDPILQQGFEIICKNLTELEKDNRLLEQRGSDILKELLDKNKRCKELERQIEKMEEEHKQEILDLVLSNSSERADLENKIADIKANCDLAIEGRDIKIIELEQQIEKMKCCGNCGRENCTSKYRGNSAYHRQTNGFACADNEEWKLKEIEK